MTACPFLLVPFRERGVECHRVTSNIKMLGYSLMLNWCDVMPEAMLVSSSLAFKPCVHTLLKKKDFPNF